LALARRIENAGKHTPLVMQAFVTGMIIFGSAIASPDDSAGLWLTRLFQFILGGLFAVLMMNLVWQKR
jgi:energy-converting hydrogenase Eha subunit B